MELKFEDFNGRYNTLNGIKTMNINRLELCRHVMQVGYNNRRNFIGASWYKHLQLFFMVCANVKEESGILVLKDDYSDLDPSEKVCVSYQLGQGLTKAMAEEYLKIPWVTHFKTMKTMGCTFNVGGKKKKIIDSNENSGSEPDLVGYDKNGDIHLLESKGSSYNTTADKIIQKAINQVSNIVDITNSKVRSNFSTRSACIFNFKDNFHGRIIDPPVDGNDINEKKYFGLIQCLYDYYCDFFYEYNNGKIETRNILDREWEGCYFSFGNEQYFWGIDLSFRKFLMNQIFGNSELIKKITSRPEKLSKLEEWKAYYDGDKEKEILAFFKKKEILAFFKKRDTDRDPNTSVGLDFFILHQI
ncbi:hypothetical protein [Acetobacterium tundrae]|uniref:Uncharacterized protein n=1 Tax=Acetobacterium tundrae TaxID=132932 RepID=A0ABR6WQ15_9FIRM|nr:hypothetical protein [Acetobacterium tundrae]MBC3798541.1 hypothetical protein [Acetobacterium tundrae]